MTREARAANEAAWDLVAAKKSAPDVERDAERLRGGGSSLLPPELETLAPLLPSCRRAIHLRLLDEGRRRMRTWEKVHRE